MEFISRCADDKNCLQKNVKNFTNIVHVLCLDVWVDYLIRTNYFFGFEAK